MPENLKVTCEKKLYSIFYFFIILSGVPSLFKGVLAVF
jgi:hypothetical protein